MKSEDLYDTFRREMSDEVEDFLWSEDDVYGYIDDAQKMFCRLTDGISDASTAEVTSIPIAVDDDWVDLHPSILKIRGVTTTSDGASIRVINYEDMEGENIRFDGRTGPVRRLIVGMEENKARVYPVASVADELALIVFRLPLVDITPGEGELEIASQHHRHLLLWAKHLAYEKQDAETFDRTKASEFEEKFRAYCFKAKQEQEAKRHKVRVVAYGGI